MRNFLDDVTIQGELNCVDIYSEKGTVRHVNRHSLGLITSTAGSVEYYLNGETFVSDKNTVLLMPAQVSYTLKCTKADVSHVLNFYADVKIDKIYTFKKTENMENVFVRTVKTFVTKRPTYKTATRALIYSLILRLCEQTAYDAYPDHLVKCIEYIYENYGDEKLSNEKIASHANISVVYLQKQFVKYTSESPRKFLTGVRVSAAQDMLLSQTKSVSEVAQAVGYSSVYSFSRAFKLATGKSPLQYRLTAKL